MQGKELLSLLEDEPFRIASQIGLVAEVNPVVVKTFLREQFCPVGSNYKGQLDPTLTEQLAVIYKSFVDTVDDEGDELYPPCSDCCSHTLYSIASRK